MKTLEYDHIVEEVAHLCKKAAVTLDPDAEKALRRSAEKETSKLGISVLKSLAENAEIAREDDIPLCQDTGTAVFFIDMGTEISIDAGTIYEAVTEGTAKGYTEGFLRKSIVDDPLFARTNTEDNTPPIIHLTLTPGSNLSITVLLKGAGSENMSKATVLTPFAGEDEVVDFVVRTVVEAGANPCPPTVVGVGIGGNFETAPYLAKKALLRTIGPVHPDERYAQLEATILKELNKSGVGPEGLGGCTTSLAVFIETYPCHMASLPVAVNINCHAVRHASVTL